MIVVAGFCMYDVIVNKFTFVIASPDEFLSIVLESIYKTDHNNITHRMLS